jgi:glycosyltransferase involved in cell wall biosynthesis
MGSIHATFVLEQHLGHRTFAENLATSAERHPDLHAQWTQVNYARTSGPPNWLPLPEGLRSALAGRKEVRAGIGRAPSDVLVFNTQVPAALGGRIARSRPYVVITDVTPVQYDEMAAGYAHRVDRRGPMRSLKQRLNDKVFRGASHCIGWSAWAARSITDDYGVEADRVSVIPPGVDTEEWRPVESLPHDRFNVLFVGGDFERKGGRQLLDAFRTLPARAALHLVTRTPVPASDRIHVLNDLSPNDPRLIELYRSSDVFVLPSLAETFGIAAVEASACGLPVVASSTGGLAEIVQHGETGLVVEPADARALARALTRLEADPGLRARLGAAGRRRAVEHFDADRNAAKVFEVIRQVAVKGSAERASRE